MTRTIRLFLLFEAATFVTAAMIHFGVLIDGYEHQRAGVAETVIAVVLFTGLTLSWISPARTRRSGLAAQAFALLGRSACSPLLSASVRGQCQILRTTLPS